MEIEPVEVVGLSRRLDQCHRCANWRPAMNSAISRYWPFDVGDPRRHTEREKREIRFLEEAYRLGYQPFELGMGMESYGATASSGRVAEILYRGRSGWEMAVYDADVRVVNAFVNDFQCSADAVLDWLGGGTEAGVVARVEKNVVLMPGLSPGSELVVGSSQATSHQPSP
ncbi:MAG TPA: hypothetical protein VFI31_22065 [Pirellulales bacterium]|nr:hypothetical protein [Pirellulales bacterium]